MGRGESEAAFLLGISTLETPKPSSGENSFRPVICITINAQRGRHRMQMARVRAAIGGGGGRWVLLLGPADSAPRAAPGRAAERAVN